MNREPIVSGEYYHVYNRGVDKRLIVEEEHDSERFIQCMEVFNSEEPVGSLFEISFKEKTKSNKKLVNIVSYCLNPNHYHFLLQQVVDGGVGEFMKRLNGGYTWYFNNKYKRSGALFQGVYKSKHVDNNEYLLHLSAYINLNDKIHQLGGETAKLVRSSWQEVTGDRKGIVELDKKVILGQFKDAKSYGKFALGLLSYFRGRKEDQKGLEKFLFAE